MTHPDILKAEKFGSRNEIRACTIHCVECGAAINKLYDEYYTDGEGNSFCCETCAIEHYGIRQMGV